MKGDQLLTSDLFGQGQGFAREGCRTYRVIATERERGKIAEIGGYTFSVIDRLSDSQSLLVLVFGGFEISGVMMATG